MRPNGPRRCCRARPCNTRCAAAGGACSAKPISKAFGRPLHNELLSGIPNSPQEHYAAPYAITEEFTAVYRLHSLIPDDYSFRRHGDDKELLACTLADLFAGGTTRVHRSEPFEDVLYSLGTSYPGLPVLHNFPTHLRKIPEKPGTGDLHRPRR